MIRIPTNSFTVSLLLGLALYPRMICVMTYLFIKRFKDQTYTVSSDAVIRHNILFHPMADIFILVVMLASWRRRRGRTWRNCVACLCVQFTLYYGIYAFTMCMSSVQMFEFWQGQTHCHHLWIKAVTVLDFMKNTHTHTLSHTQKTLLTNKLVFSKGECAHCALGETWNIRWVTWAESVSQFSPS